MTPFELLIASLAAWRVAYAMTAEACPFNVCLWLRKRFPLGGLTTCIKCATFWTALVMLAMLHIHPLEYVVYVFAVSGAEIMLAAYTGAGRLG